jgi:hypothetical protein
MNIVSLAMNMLTPAIIGRIATALGVNPTIAQMAITAVIPAIFGGIAGKAAQPSGLGVLTGLLGQQTPSMLGNLGDLIGGSGQANLVSGGTSALNTLFGNSTTSALASAVGKFAGVPEAASSSLLGMLAPVALGTLAQQQKSSGLDAGGLASLLAGQKDNIAGALPKGFGDLLKGTGLLDSVMPSAPSAGTMAAAATTAAAAAGGAAKSAVAGAASTAGHAAQSAAQAASATASRVGAGVQDAGRAAASHMPSAPAVTSSGISKWLPLLAALAAAVLGYSFWQSSRGPAVPTATKIMYNNVDVGAKASSLYEGIKSSVAGIKDEASANVALPKLREHANALGEMRELADKMPADGRKGLAGIFQGLVPGLEGLILTALKVPGLPAGVKPVLEQVLERAKALSKA